MYLIQATLAGDPVIVGAGEFQSAAAGSWGRQRAWDGLPARRFLSNGGYRFPSASRYGCGWDARHRPIKRRVVSAASLGPPTQMGGAGDWSRPGSRIYFFEGDELALKGRHVLTPKEPKRLQVLVGHGAALVVGDSQSLELLLGPANAYSQNEASSAQLIHAGAGSRGLKDATVGKDNHRGADLNALGYSRQPTQGGKWLVEGSGIPRLHIGGDGDVVCRSLSGGSPGLQQAAPNSLRPGGWAPGPKLIRLTPIFMAGSRGG